MYIQLYTRHWYPLYICFFLDIICQKQMASTSHRQRGYTPFWRNAGSLAPSDQTAQEIKIKSAPKENLQKNSDLQHL